jgi:hypothetical protein
MHDCQCCTSPVASLLAVARDQKHANDFRHGAKIVRMRLSWGHAGIVCEWPCAMCAACLPMKCVPLCSHLRHRSNPTV